ncbi:MAG: thioredoxin-disulfide reductase [Candidatus Omnitrophica bacterium]|nr:thioredoxin-disulfide reductase [Candidatus Omnitrophota bacterium]
MSLNTYDLIIIGAGPAGLTAALYAGRSRLKTLVLEKIGVGGRILLTEVIENFPGFRGGIETAELINRMQEQVKSLDVDIVTEEVLEIDAKTKSVKTNAGEYTCGVLIIATGAEPRKLGVPGEDKLTGRGVSYCATCDGPLYRDKSVVIVGGGNAMAEEALYLTRYAKSVTIIHRRDQLRASPILQEKLKENKKISFVLSSVITEITGSSRAESIKVKDLTNSQDKVIPCDGIFIYIGYIPDTDFAKGKLKLDETGFIITGEDMSTSEEGIFACGDCRSKTLYQVITACGDGAVAADSAYKYLVSKK